MQKSVESLLNNPIKGTIGTEPTITTSAKPSAGIDDPAVIGLCTNAKSLLALQDDFVLFNHYAFLTVGKMPIDPLIEFANRRALPKGVLGLVVTKQPMFINIAPEGSDQTPNHVLGMIAKKYWPDLEKWLDTIGCINRDKKIYFQVLKQVIPVPDMLAIQSGSLVSPCPMVDVTMYGLDGNRCCYHYVPAKTPPMDLPYLKKDEPILSTKAIAAAMFNESADPLALMQGSSYGEKI